MEWQELRNLLGYYRPVCSTTQKEHHFTQFLQMFAQDELKCRLVALEKMGYSTNLRNSLPCTQCALEASLPFFGNKVYSCRGTRLVIAGCTDITQFKTFCFSSVEENV